MWLYLFKCFTVRVKRLEKVCNITPSSLFIHWIFVTKKKTLLPFTSENTLQAKGTKIRLPITQENIISSPDVMSYMSCCTLKLLSMGEIVRNNHKSQISLLQTNFSVNTIYLL